MTVSSIHPICDRKGGFTVSTLFARARKSRQFPCVSPTLRVSATLTSCALVVLVAATGITSCENNEFARVGDDVCLSCHDGGFAYDATGLKENVHALFGVSCEDCHGPGYLHVRNGGRAGLFIVNPSDAGFQEAYGTCANCHAPIIEKYEESVHFTSQAANCFDCHNIHRNPPHVLPYEDNTLCLSCHAMMGFGSDEAVEFHAGPFHDLDPEGTGEGRCTICHMVPLSQFHQDTGVHSHTFRPVAPIETLEAIEAGVRFPPPNTCAGIAGCHDPNVPGSGSPRDVNDVSNIEVLQNLYGVVGGFQE